MGEEEAKMTVSSTTEFYEGIQAWQLHHASSKLYPLLQMLFVVMEFWAV
jgi:hypothetical protein